MVKAIGAALLLHLLIMALIQEFLPRPPIAEPLAASVVVFEPESPIAIEFLAPPSRPVLVPVAGATPARPTAPNSSVTPARHSAPGGVAGKSSISRTHAQAGATQQAGDVSVPAPLASAPGPGSFLSMRRGTAGPGIPQLHGRLEPTGVGAPGPSAPAAGDGSGSGHRPDLLAAGAPGPSRDSSSWRPSGGGTMRATKQPFNAAIRQDGTIVFHDKPNVAVEGIRFSEKYQIPVLAGRFDVTDAVMSALGEKLYPYRKMKLMDESRTMRMGMAAASQRDDLKSALKNYDKHLRWVWSQDSMSLWDRKKALFALWDECAEEGSSDVIATANSVRAMTLAFIRLRLPDTSDTAYTADELQALNERRRSQEAFAPY